MTRLNISFTDKDAKRLARERKETGISTSTLVRQLLANYFAEKDRKAKQNRSQRQP